jgi:acetolactate synthase regulatory subunit
MEGLARCDKGCARSPESRGHKVKEMEKSALVNIDSRSLTLKLILALTFSPSTCAMALSKLVMILMAS